MPPPVVGKGTLSANSGVPDVAANPGRFGNAPLVNTLLLPPPVTPIAPVVLPTLRKPDQSIPLW